MIKAWSYSLAKQFKRCPYSVKLQKIDGSPGPERADNHPITLGEQLHLNMEQYIKGEIDTLDKRLSKFVEPIEEFREAYPKGYIQVEEEWAFTQNLEPTGWRSNDCWLRVKLDIFVELDQHNAIVIDLKTGRRDGNEVAHTQQGKLYALAAFLRNSELTNVNVDFWYSKEKKRVQRHYTREQILSYAPRLLNLGMQVTRAEHFPPKPNPMNCKYCDYGPVNGTNACHYGVE